jgi:gamma-D-glutamyl-L-lysine dipeptidyl-peptidase
MEYGICLLAYAPLRAEPEHRSEMVSQLIFGEVFRVLKTRNDWYFVQMHQDLYQGWVAASQISMLKEKEYERLVSEPQYISSSHVSHITNVSKDEHILISAGSSLPFMHRDGGLFCGQSFSFAGHYHRPSGDFVPADFQRFARLFLHTPYLWGGRSVFGMDCSGFVQLVYKMCGLSIPRDAAMQASTGETIHLIHEARTGDLMFFDNQEDVITHVGLMLDKGIIIHAHGKVRLDLIDHQGIFNRDLKKYTHKLRIIKRYATAGKQPAHTPPPL